MHVGRYRRGVPAETHMPDDCATSRLSRAELLQRVLPVAEAIPGAAQERSVLALPGCNCAASALGADLHRLVLADLSHLDRTSAYELQHERRLKPAPGQQQHGLPSPRQRDVEQSSFLGELERLSHWHRQRRRSSTGSAGPSSPGVHPAGKAAACVATPAACRRTVTGDPGRRR